MWALITRTLAICALLPLLTMPGVHAAKAPSAGDVLRQAEERFQSMNDYVCIANSENYRKDPPSHGSYKIWHKKPRLLRIQVLKGGNRGSALAVDENGKIRGRKGGILKAIVVRLSRNDDRLKNWRGGSALDMDWGSFYRNLRARAGRPGGKMALSPQSGGDYEIVATYPENGRKFRDTCRIDGQTLYLEESATYVDGKLADRVTFHDVEVDTGVDNKTFRL
jgi:outer membrane lipoprotein-sorting protein